MKETPYRWGFPYVEDGEFGLTEISSGIWDGFIFINFDENCELLDDFLEILPDHFKDLELESRYVAIHTYKEPVTGRCAWKAFMFWQPTRTSS